MKKGKSAEMIGLPDRLPPTSPVCLATIVLLLFGRKAEQQTLNRLPS
jgi:hypothetical protein